jgi:segregation and condensation protein B
VNPEQDGGSLADRAAAWVPPWERPADRGVSDEGGTRPVEAPGDTPVDDTPDDPADDPTELDREIDADIARETGQADLGSTDVDDPDERGDVDHGAASADELDTDAESAAVESTEPTTEPTAEPVEPTAEPVEPTTEPAEPTAEPVGPSPLPGLAGAELGAALEAILMVVDEPVTEAHLADVLDVAPDDVAERLGALAIEYAESGRGFELRRAAGGWRFYTRGEYSAYVERFVLDGQSARLTQAALETLAVVAYQQPVTRSRISAIRGVNCDGVVRTLVTRGLLEEGGTQPETGAYLYRTTTLFLEKLGLDSVDQLPPLAPFLPDDVNGLTDAQR